MKKSNIIHLNGYPNKQGVIVERIGFDKLFHSELVKVKWNSGKISNNHIKTLCQCTNGECKG